MTEASWRRCCKTAPEKVDAEGDAPRRLEEAGRPVGVVVVGSSGTRGRTEACGGRVVVSMGLRTRRSSAVGAQASRLRKARQTRARREQRTGVAMAASASGWRKREGWNGIRTEQRFVVPVQRRK
jgi:hypothetical protein